MGCQISVAEAEPIRFCVVGPQLLGGVESLLGPTPRPLLVDSAAQRVHHRVEVGADLQAEQPDVVADVADDGDLVVARA